MSNIQTRKKILYIITKSVWAGASKYTYDLATNLPKNTFCTMVAGGQKGPLAQKLITKDIPYFEIKGFQRDVNPFRDILTLFEITSLLFRTKPDIIHVSSAKAGGLAGVAFFIYKIFKLKHKPKAIFTVHGWTFNEPRSSWQIYLIKLFSKLTCFFYDKVICVSKYDYEMALKNKMAPKNKLVMIHNGIKKEDYAFLSKEEAVEYFLTHHGLEKTGCVIGSIGEFTKNKGYEYLIDAIKKIRAVHKRLLVILIGFDGGEKHNLENQIKKNRLKNNVALINNIPNASKYLKAFDIFVLPSLKEGLPYVLLEAGLAKLPIITTNTGGIPEIIKGGTDGIVVEPANKDELSKSIEKLIGNNALKHKLSQNIFQKVINEFSFEKMLRETAGLYE